MNNEKNSINNALSPIEEYGVYFLNGEVNFKSTGDLIRFILSSNLNHNSSLDHLTLFINSPGGICSAGFALIDVMFGSKIPIKTVGIGMIASMGLQIFLAGEKGSRTLTPNCLILSHQFSGGQFGKEHELVAGQKRYTHVSDMMMRHYIRTTGMSKEDIKKYLLPAQDVWLTPKEAKKFGICDVIKDLKPNIYFNESKLIKKNKMSKSKK